MVLTEEDWQQFEAARDNLKRNASPTGNDKFDLLLILASGEGGFFWAQVIASYSENSDLYDDEEKFRYGGEDVTILKGFKGTFFVTSRAFGESLGFVRNRTIIKEWKQEVGFHFYANIVKNAPEYTYLVKHGRKPSKRSFVERNPDTNPEIKSNKKSKSKGKEEPRSQSSRTAKRRDHN